MYFGSDSFRQELVCKGHGQLMSARRSAGNFSANHLIRIMHNASKLSLPLIRFLRRCPPPVAHLGVR